MLNLNLDGIYLVLDELHELVISQAINVGFNINQLQREKEKFFCFQIMCCSKALRLLIGQLFNH